MHVLFGFSEAINIHNIVHELFLTTNNFTTKLFDLFNRLSTQHQSLAVMVI